MQIIPFNPSLFAVYTTTITNTTNIYKERIIMDLKVTQENLNKALSNVARIASSRTTLPILNNILLQTVDNRLKLSATNLDIAISQHIGTKINKEGSLTIPARLLQDYVNNLPSTTISLKQDGQKLNISADNYKSTINGVLVDEYPVMPAIKNGKNFTLEAQKLKKALQQVLFSASTDESRPVLTAVYFHTHNKTLFLVATDSYRLAEKQLTKLNQEVSLLIPVSAIQDLVRVIGDQAEEVTVLYDDQQVQFSVDNIDLIARLIDGTYPDYKKLIPSKFSNSASIDRNQFISITKVAGLFSRENSGSITVSVSEEAENLEVESIASQIGENKASLKGKINGTNNITLNSKYLLDGLQAMNGKEVDFCFNEKLEPIVITDKQDSSYVYVVMPLKS